MAIPFGMVALQAPCQEQASRILEQLIGRWEWESYWDGAVTAVRYQSHQNATVEVFWNAELVGVCSPQVSGCALYERKGASIRQFLDSLVQPPGVDVRQMTDAFLRKLREPRVIVEEANNGPARQAGGADRYEGGGKVMAVPSPPNEVIVERNTKGLQTCVVTREHFPRLRTPQPIRDKVRPSNLAEFERWLRERLQPGPSGTSSEYVIPYYAPTDPVIYILVNVNGASESIVIVAPASDDVGWRIGGHFDSKESPKQMERLRSLVLAARMTSILR